MKDQRLDYIDMFRGIGILLMIAGHVGFGTKFSHYISAFHMPMFFFLSGFFYRETSSQSIGFYIIKKAKALLVPYMIFGLFHYIAWIAVSRGNFDVEPYVSASKEGVVLFPPPIDILGKTNIF